MTLTDEFREIVFSYHISEGEYQTVAQVVETLIQAVKDRDNEVFGWLYRENPNVEKEPETEEEWQAANNEKARIAKRMEDSI